MVRIVLFSLLFFIDSEIVFGQHYLGDKDRDVYDIAVQGNMMGAITANSVELWNLQDMALTKSISYNDKDAASVVCFGMDSMTLVVGKRSGEVVIWNMVSGESSRLVSAQNMGAVTSMDINPERKLLAVGFSKKRMALYSLVEMKEEFSYTDYAKDVTALKFSKDNNWLITGDGSGQILRISLDTKRSDVICRNKGWITSLGMSSDSKQMGFTNSKGKLMIIKNITVTDAASSLIWETKYGHFITSLDYRTGEANWFSLSFLSGGMLIGSDHVSYSYGKSQTVNQVRFIPTKNNTLVVAIATLGKGLQIIKADDMKLKH